MRLDDAISAFRYGAALVLSEDRDAEANDRQDDASALLRKMRYCMSGDDWERFVGLVRAADDADRRSPK